MSKQWTAEQINEMARGYQAGCVLGALAELELFDSFAGAQFTAEQAAGKLSADLRGIRALLDAAAALGLIDKRENRYSIPASVADTLTATGRHSVLAMVQHQMNCLRNWAQLAHVVKTGKPSEREPSIRGKDKDYEAFIEAMDNISGPVAGRVVSDLRLPPFKRLLDVGGGSGTWTLALLRRSPDATATIFDLPHVISQAERRIAAAGLAERVDFVGGNFYVDPLPVGTDLAWVSAIVHQNSRQQNRELFRSLARAVAPGGHVLIRDIVMEESRTAPPSGAMFAINMLVNTERGGTFTLAELREDLEHAGFADVQLVRRDEGMNSVVQAARAS